MVGASGVFEPNWIPTDVETLNLLNPASWHRFLSPNSVNSILAEHVWEHLTEAEGQIAAQTCFQFLKSGGRLRVAVPDGAHPDPAYISYISPPAMGHQALYTYASLKQIFERVGFCVEMLEWFDENGDFHAHPWLPADGMIHRSARFDERNEAGKLSATSIILDAIKP